jgi:molybdopterin molybdotransferase
MMSVDEARNKIFAGLRPVGREIVPLAAAYGRVLGADIAARVTQPPADVSAMDGFALRAEDVSAGARLKVVGEAPAGHPFAGEIGTGEAVRLFTGSVVPAGADTVLIQENAVFADGWLTVLEAVAAGKNIRPTGQDFASGEVLLRQGRRLSPRDIGLAAAGNFPWVEVYRRPRIAILATGDEIFLPGETIGDGGVVSSNAHALAALTTEAGAEATILPIAGDSLAAMAQAAEAARGADMLVTTGGVSVGAHDHVQAGLEAQGMVLEFWKIAMRPGKPLMFGRLADMPVLGLPGNPVSAFVCAILLLRPAIDVLAGLPAAAPVLTRAILGAELPENDSREDFLRATLSGDGVVTPFPKQDSGMLKTLARAQALIRRPPHDPARMAGDMVEILSLGP